MQKEINRLFLILPVILACFDWFCRCPDVKLTYRAFAFFSLRLSFWLVVYSRAVYSYHSPTVLNLDRSDFVSMWLVVCYVGLTALSLGSL